MGFISVSPAQWSGPPPAPGLIHMTPGVQLQVGWGCLCASPVIAHCIMEPLAPAASCLQFRGGVRQQGLQLGAGRFPGETGPLSVGVFAWRFPTMLVEQAASI